ncbi:MAG: hypothetical protein JST04_09070 [Bdellovibrionales bacterium]|nr:hypothetical protein [Bdellovibrionales bacterium]
MKKPMLASLALLALSTVPALAGEFDSSAIVLGNRLLECGDLPSLLKKDGYALIGAEENVLVAPKAEDFPAITKAETKIYFGKGLKPMQGYSSVAEVDVASTTTCYGSPAADGVCKEVVSSCARK